MTHTQSWRANVGIIAVEEFIKFIINHMQRTRDQGSESHVMILMCLMTRIPFLLEHMTQTRTCCPSYYTMNTAKEIKNNISILCGSRLTSKVTVTSRFCVTFLLLTQMIKTETRCQLYHGRARGTQKWWKYLWKTQAWLRSWVTIPWPIVFH